MIAVAIVEDEESASKQLTEYINRYGKEQGEQFQVSLFSNVGSFLEPYKKVDIVFMDIIMPGLNGMDGARQMREIDPETKIVFVTNMAQYAVQGYEVDALDFVVKPVNYKDFSYKMNRVVKAVKNHRRTLVYRDSRRNPARLCAGYFVRGSGTAYRDLSHDGWRIPRARDNEKCRTELAKMAFFALQ